MKQFKTHNVQLKMLRDKGLTINNASRVKRILERENYFTIINGYREVFAFQKSPFRFEPGTAFEHIYWLYELDRELRSIYLLYLLKMEKMLQSLIGYYFAETHKNNNRAYLDFKNFRFVHSKIKRHPKPNEIHRTIAMFSNKIGNNHDKVMNHYITKHQEIPFWVLVTTLTLGELGYVYFFLKDSIRDQIAKKITALSRNEYDDRALIVQPTNIDDFIFGAKRYRNACAHNELLYNLRDASIQNIRFLLEKSKMYLAKKDYKQFEKSVYSIYTKYECKFTPNQFNKIKALSGF